MMLGDARLELAIREVLDATIDRKREIAARLRLAQELDVLDDLPVQIADHTLHAGLAREPVVERELEAFLTAIVDVREAEHVRHDFAVRVVTAEFALARDARNAERQNLLRVVRIQMTLEIDELLVRALHE